MTSGYGQWLKHRVASGVDSLRSSSSRGMKLSLQHSAAALSVLLVVLYIVQSQGGSLLQGRRLQEVPEGGKLLSAGSAWSMPRMCESHMLASVFARSLPAPWCMPGVLVCAAKLLFCKSVCYILKCGAVCRVLLRPDRLCDNATSFASAVFLVSGCGLP